MQAWIITVPGGTMASLGSLDPSPPPPQRGHAFRARHMTILSQYTILCTNAYFM